MSLAPFVDPSSSQTRKRGHRELMELTLTRIFDDVTPLEQSLAKFVEFICFADAWESGVVWLADQTGLLSPVAGTSSGELAVRAYREGEVVCAPGLGAAFPISDSRQTIGVIELFNRSLPPMNDESVRALHDTGLAVGRLIERERLVKAIQRKGMEWAGTFDAIESPIFLTSSDGTVVRMNRAGRDLAGGTYASILGRRVGALRDGEVWRSLDDLVRVVVETRESCSARAMQDDRHWDISGSVYVAEGEDRVILILRDITRIVTLQESVRRGEQLAAMGELVAGVAHEVRNPLFGISATLDAYSEEMNTDELREMAATLRDQVGRLSRLMKELLEFGKPVAVTRYPGALDSLIGEVIASRRAPAAEAKVEIRSHIDADVPLIPMDHERLRQVFENVVDNALQHAPAGTAVTISGDVLLHAGQYCVEIRVEDEGKGFLPGETQHVFEPFFTRRERGTGLGLSIVQKIVEEHDGIVTASNRAQGGARITIRLPA
jgi:signal transduction histidine kinase